MFQKSFQAAKWARTNTGISRGQVNLGNVLCELARRIFGRIDQCRVLVLGAGEVAESALEAFKSRGSEAITVTGRTFDWCPLSRRKPDELAQKFDGFTLAYSKFHESLHLFDVVLASTASANPLLSKTQVEQAMKKRPSKPLFIIDASVPRNVEECSSSVDNVFLYNMDDVSAIANENLQSAYPKWIVAGLPWPSEPFVYGIKSRLSQAFLPELTTPLFPGFAGGQAIRVTAQRSFFCILPRILIIQYFRNFLSENLSICPTL